MSLAHPFVRDIFLFLFFYKLDYSDGREYGLLLDTDVVTVAIASNSDVYGFKFSTVSSFFNLWFLGDTLSRVFFRTN